MLLWSSPWRPVFAAAAMASSPDDSAAELAAARTQVADLTRQVHQLQQQQALDVSSAVLHATRPLPPISPGHSLITSPLMQGTRRPSPRSAGLPNAISIQRNFCGSAQMQHPHQLGASQSHSSSGMSVCPELLFALNCSP